MKGYQFLHKTFYYIYKNVKYTTHIYYVYKLEEINVITYIYYNLKYNS